MNRSPLHQRRHLLAGLAGIAGLASMGPAWGQAPPSALERIRKRVESTDWVDSAVVTRVWPDAIRVVVNEEVAAARWNDAGLLNARGELFIRNARYVPPELPLLEGPEGSQTQVAQLYIDAQGRLLESGLRLTGVRLDDRGAWVDEGRLKDHGDDDSTRRVIDSRTFVKNLLTLARAAAAK